MATRRNPRKPSNRVSGPRVGLPAVPPNPGFDALINSGGDVTITGGGSSITINDICPIAASLPATPATPLHRVVGNADPLVDGLYLNDGNGNWIKAE